MPVKKTKPIAKKTAAAKAAKAKATKTKSAPKGKKAGGEKAGKKRMVVVSFTGRELLEGKVFDTTSAAEAKKAGAYDEKRKYRPLTIILGESEMLPKVEEALAKMKAGESRKVLLPPSEGFGSRDRRFVIVMPLKNFLDQKINPVPGLVIQGEINGRTQTGKVQSVSGGRVRVDFNHPLAGREIEYNVKIEREVKGKKDVAEAIYEKYYSLIPGAKKEIKNNELYITLGGNSYKNLGGVNDTIAKLGKGFGVKITFRKAGKGKGEKAKK